MKSPFRYSKWPIALYFLIGSFFVGITLNSFVLSGGTLTLGRILWGLGGIAFMTVCGWLVAMKLTGTILHRKVDHPVKTHELILNHQYWLNGQTPAIFIGVMDYTGKYLFHVPGYHKKDRPRNAKDLFPDQVRAYISTVKEV